MRIDALLPLTLAALVLLPSSAMVGPGGVRERIREVRPALAGDGPPRPRANVGIDVDGSFLDWEIDDLVALDDPWDVYRFEDGFDDSRDLVALYYRAGEDGLALRLDLYDLRIHAEEGAMDLYVAMDWAEGGQCWLPDFTDCQTDLPWEACVAVYQTGLGVVYDTTFTDVQALEAVAFHSQWDAVELRLSAGPLQSLGWSPASEVRLQAFTCRDGTNGGAGEIPNTADLTDTIPADAPWEDGWLRGSVRSTDRAGTAKVAIFHHGNQFLKDVGEFVRDSSGNGFIRVPEIHDKWKVPVDLHVSGTLAEAAQWHAPFFNAYLRELHDAGIVEMVGGFYAEYIPKYLPPEVNAWSMAYARTYNALYYNDTEIPVCWVPERVFWDGYETLVASGGYEAVMVDTEYGFVRFAQPAGFTDEHKLYTEDNGIKILFISNRGKGGAAHNLQDQLHNNHDGGLSYPMREALLRMAQGSDRDRYFLYMDDWEKTCGNIPDWGGPEVVVAYDNSIGWLAQHPWCEVVTLEDLLNLPSAGTLDINDCTYFWIEDKMGSAHNYDAWYYDPLGEITHGTSYFDYVPLGCQKKLGDWKTPGTLLFDVWEAAKTIPGTSPFYELAMKTLSMGYYETAWRDDGMGSPISYWEKEQAAHTRTVGYYVRAQEWFDHRPEAVLSSAEDVDFDGVNEFVLASPDLLAIFEPRGGKLAFACDGEGRQIVGNTPTGWLAEEDAYTDAVTSTTANVHYQHNPARYLCGSKVYAFSDLDHENDLYAGTADGTTIRFESPDGAVTKRVTISAGAIIAQYAASGPLSVRMTATPDLKRVLREGDVIAGVGGSKEEVKGWRTGDAFANVSLSGLDLRGSGRVTCAHYIEVSGSGGFAVKLTIASGETVPPNRPPTVDITRPENGSRVSGTVLVSGTAWDDAAVLGLRLRIGSTWVDLEPGTSWSYLWNASAHPNGTVELVAEASDGELAATDSVFVTVEHPATNQTPPTNQTNQTTDRSPWLSIVYPSNGTEVRGEVRVTGRAGDDEAVLSVEVRVDGGIWRAANEDLPGWAVWSFLWNASAAGSGNHTIEARALDDSHEARTTVTVVVLSEDEGPTIPERENRPPLVTVLDPGPDLVPGAVTLRGTASDPEGALLVVEVRLGDGPWTQAQGTERWSYTATLDVGAYTLAARALDDRGACSPEIVVTFRIEAGGGDGGDLELAISGPQRLEAGAEVSFTFSVLPANATVSSARWRIDDGAWQTIALSGGSANATLSLTEGAHILTFEVVNGSGRTRSVSYQVWAEPAPEEGKNGETVPIWQWAAVLLGLGATVAFIVVIKRQR